MSETSNPPVQPTIDGLELKSKVVTLQNLLQGSNPQIATVLQDIHRMIKADPEQVTILSPEDIGTIVSGLQKHTGNYLATAVVKSTTKSSTAKLKSLNLDDI